MIFYSPLSLYLNSFFLSPHLPLPTRTLFLQHFKSTPDNLSISREVFSVLYKHLLYFGFFLTFERQKQKQKINKSVTHQMILSAVEKKSAEEDNYWVSRGRGRQGRNILLHKGASDKASLRRRHLNSYWVNLVFLDHTEVVRETQRHHLPNHPLRGLKWRRKSHHRSPKKVLFIRGHRGKVTALHGLHPFTCLILPVSSL